MRANGVALTGPCVAVAVACVALFAGTSRAIARQDRAAAGKEQQAFAQFDAALQNYLTLRKRVNDEIPPLAVTDKPEEIVQTSDALARAIERQRGAAKPGEFFTTEVATLLRARLAKVAARPDVRDMILPEDDEKPEIASLRVHARFPLTSSMPTTPTAVLDVLPPIPGGLEFRFVGTTLILRDVEAALIIDFLPNAVK